MKKVLFTLSILLFFLPGCSDTGISQEEYESIVAEKDQYKTDFESIESELNILQGNYESVVAQRDKYREDCQELAQQQRENIKESLSESETQVQSEIETQVETQKPIIDGVVYEDECIRVEYNGVKERKYGRGYEIIVTVENLTDHSMTVQVRETSINGYMVDPLYSIDIAPGKKYKDGLVVCDDEAEEHPMSSIENIETKFHCFNYDIDWRHDTEAIVIFQK